MNALSHGGSLKHATVVVLILIGLLVMAVPGFAQDEAAPVVPLNEFEQQAVLERLTEEGVGDDVAALRAAGTYHRELGEYALAEFYFRTALDLAWEQLGPEHVDIAHDLLALARVKLAQRQLAEGDALLREAIAMLETLEATTQFEYGNALRLLGLLHELDEDSTEAQSLLRRSIAVFEQLPGVPPLELARALEKLGEVLIRQGQWAEAAELKARGLPIERAHTQDPTSMISSYAHVAGLYQRVEENEAALPYAQEALALTAQRYGDDSAEYAQRLEVVALLHYDLERPAEALASFEALLKLQELQADSALGSLTTLQYLAVLYNQAQRYAEAEPIARRLLEIAEQSRGAKAPEVAHGARYLGEALFYLGRPSEALVAYERAYGIDSTDGSAAAEALTDLNWLVFLTRETQNWKQAAHYAALSLKLTTSQHGAESLEAARGQMELGTILLQLDPTPERLTRAEEQLRSALAIITGEVGEQHPETALALAGLGEVLYARDQLEPARDLFTRALAINDLPEGSAEAARSNVEWLALITDQLGDYDLAVTYYRRQLQNDIAAAGSNDVVTAASMVSLAVVLLRLDHGATALAQSEMLLHQSLAIDMREYGEESVEVAGDLSHLGQIHYLLGELGEARKYYSQSRALYLALEGPESYGVTNADSWLAEIGPVVH